LFDRRQPAWSKQNTPAASESCGTRILSIITAAAISNNETQATEPQSRKPGRQSNGIANI
jgi:hypothetical protein